MEDQIILLRSYLPLKFEDEQTQEFIDYLISAFNENYTNNKFQFSFTAFHMLYMSYIYKCKWFLNNTGNASIKNSLEKIAQQDKISFNNLFDLSQINEKTSVEKLMLGLNFHVNEIGICKHFVDVRNNCAHASGKIYYKRLKQIENIVQDEIESVETIHKRMQNELKSTFELFVDNTWNKNWLESDIESWIVRNYLSEKDIEYLVKVKFTFLRYNSNNKEIILRKILYSAFVGFTVKILNNSEELFLKSLSHIVFGLVEKVDFRNSIADAEKMRNSQELIEERVYPLILQIAPSDLKKAQRILETGVVY